MALRRIVLLKTREGLTRGWEKREFAPAGVGLEATVKVSGFEFHEQMHPVPVYRRMPARTSVATVAIGGPGRPAELPHNAFAVVGMFDDDEAIERMKQDRGEEVLGVYADPRIEVAPAYCQGAPVGTTKDVAARIKVAPLHRKGLSGKGVRIAIVDTGIDGTQAAPDGKLLSQKINGTHGYPAGLRPGTSRRGHGTMVAYDALIAAPRATLLDYALIKPAVSTWESFISEAIAVYADLIDLLRREPGPLVVNNSWALFDRSTDDPIGTPGNYGANANHPFNQIVGALVAAGADVIFCAGNCGRDCPESRCGARDRGPGASIHGGNSHSSVLTVAAYTIENTRLGYSSQGPGDLSDRKPDVAAPSHFKGSGVYRADSGTSAASPVAAGVVALLRELRPKITPAEMKGVIQRSATAIDGGWNYNGGYGLINAEAAWKIFNATTGQRADEILHTAPGTREAKLQTSVQEDAVMIRYPFDRKKPAQNAKKPARKRKTGS